MSDNSSIEWTDATWNPIVGCSIVSPGCTNCYAMKMAGRLEKMNRTGGSGTNYVNHYDGTTKRVNGNTVWSGKLARAPMKTLCAPLGRKTPTKYFVNSMGDLFHEDCPDEWIIDALTVMAVAEHHTFQVLTKRADRMREFMGRPGLLDDIYANWAGFSGGAREVYSWPLRNVQLGVSAERQQEADRRIPFLLKTPAAVRFISAEPLLGPIDLHPLADGTNALTSSTGPNLDWVIVGGESGHSARPMHPDWARSLRDQCHAAGVAFFFKQWGEWKTQGAHNANMVIDNGKVWHPLYATAAITNNPKPGRVIATRVGKKAAGRLLDGREWSEFPGRATTSGDRSEPSQINA